MKKLHGAIGDLGRHLDRRLDQLEKLLVELSVKEVYTHIKSMTEKITLFSLNPRLKIEELEQGCKATGWTPSDLRNVCDKNFAWLNIRVSHVVDVYTYFTRSVLEIRQRHRAHPGAVEEGR